MSVSTLESENAQPVAQTQNSELIYRLEDRPPLPQTLFAACQHLLAMFVAVITPALLICQALGLPAQDTHTLLVCRCLPPVWHRLFKLRPGVGWLRVVVYSGHQLQLCCSADYGRHSAEDRWC